MKVFVLLYDVGKVSEGIHSLELSGKTVVLMFEDIEDAERYCGLLEAQDFPAPTVIKIDKEEIELFCLKSGYEPRFVENGFIPQSEEERFSLVPPQANRDTTQWEGEKENLDQKPLDPNSLDDIRNKLEGLL